MIQQSNGVEQQGPEYHSDVRLSSLSEGIVIYTHENTNLVFFPNYTSEVSKEGMTFSSWSKLVELSVELALKALSKEPLKSDLEALLPQAYQTLSRWLRDTSHSFYLEETQESKDEKTGLNISAFGNEWESRCEYIRHSRLLLSNAEIREDRNNDSSNVTICIPYREYENLVLTGPEVVGLVIQVLSDVRTRDASPDNYLPFLYSPEIEQRLSQRQGAEISITVEEKVQHQSELAYFGLPDHNTWLQGLRAALSEEVDRHIQEAKFFNVES